MSKMEESQIRCSFCGKKEAQVKRLIAGPGVCICDECVDLCCDILYEEFGDEEDSYPRERSGRGTVRLLKPVEIKKALDEYVVGQDAAKKALAVAVYNHYKRIEDIAELREVKAKRKLAMQEGVEEFENPLAGVELSKSNVLLVGPTGVGKTYLAQTLAKILNVPFAIADATSLTEAGYVGEDVENILLRLIQAADGDIDHAERGIIFIDEIDKISKRSDNPSITRDVSGEGVQQALLKILEGTVASVPPQGGRKHPHQEFLQIDTTNILFICSGAFDGMPKIIESRLGKNTIGFSGKVRSESDTDVDDLLSKIEPQDLLKFGLIPEFIGRVPSVVTLQSLDKDALKQILTVPRNALIKQYQKLLAYDDVALEFEEGAIDAITEVALSRKTGARGLRAIIESVMTDVMFNIPSIDNVEKCIVTRETVENGAQPTLVYGAVKKTSKKKDKKVAEAEENAEGAGA